MKAIAVHLQKGGVGKTSLAGALGYELSRKGRTVLVDVDPQGNLSSWHLTEAPAHELAEVLTGEVPVMGAIVRTATPDLDMLASFGIDGALKNYAETALADEPYVVQDLSAELARLGYEYAVLDLSPGMGRLERSALLGAGQVLTPLLAEFFSLDGLETFAYELSKLRKAMRYAPEHRAVIVNAYDARISQHRAIAEEADHIRGKAVVRVPVDPAFRKAQAAHVPIQALPVESAAKAETIAALRRIVEEIV